MVAVAMIAVLMSIILGIMVFGTAVVARHRAQAVADLAALAAAARLGLGAAAACSAAQAVTDAMRAKVIGCQVDGLDVVVGVGVAVELGRWGVGTAAARARAGPAEARG